MTVVTSRPANSRWTSVAAFPTTTMVTSRGDITADSVIRLITVFPQMSRSCLGRPRRVDCPAARIIPATFGRSGGVATDRSGSFGQRAAHAPFPDRDDLGHDADCHLFRRAGPDIETDRSADPRQRRIGDTGVTQSLAPVAVRLAAAHRANVWRFGLERSDQGRLIKLRVVGQDGEVRVATDAVTRKRFVRPGDDHLVRLGEALLSCQLRPGVN